MSFSNKTILGIDPGTNVLGYAVIQQMGKSIHLRQLGVIKFHKYDSHQQKLKKIFERLQEIIDIHKPTEMAVEAPFYGKNPQSMLKLGRAQGVAIAAGVTKKLEVFEYSPKKIKLAITGSGNASKEQVAGMLPNLINMSNFHVQELDATDALATAICHHFQTDNALKIGGGKAYTDWAAFIKDNPSRVK